MIQIPAMSFGYGLRVGITKVLEDSARHGPLASKQGWALTFPFLPSVAILNEAAMTPGIEFCIIPYCSPYSHLAAATWFNDLPTLAIEQPWHLLNGVTVLADFDNGLLLVAESKSEAEDLLRQACETTTVQPSHVPDSMTPHSSRSVITVLAEVTSASDVLRALADGADGLGVINAEKLFHDDNGSSSETKALIRAARANPQVLPLLVRFFDANQVSGKDHRRTHLPQGYLGYRGVRILEVDDTWFQRFVAGLENLNLAQIVVVLPMVTSVSEVRRIRRRLGLKWNRLGVTVETPAAALSIEGLLEVSDFIQIGLNDLTQYTMAWDRDVPNQERLPSDRIVEPVADLIASVAAACTIAGVPYTLGMDLRPSESLAAQVLRLGVSSISCAPSLIKPWKNVIVSQLSSTP